MKRSELMRRVKRKDTTPEVAVRKVAHAMGLRYRLHRKDLPGCPDIVFGPRRRLIFVHGCFWHRHEGCSRASTPRSNPDFWSAKFARNVARDKRIEQDLVTAGWAVLTLWECETRDSETIRSRLREFLFR